MTTRHVSASAAASSVWEFPLSGNYVSKDLTLKTQTERSYKGAVIRQVPHNSLHDNMDTYGFETPFVYQVIDDFGDPAMPELIQQKFWSPNDAAVAWDLYCAFKPRIQKRSAKWAPVMAYEFNCLMAMRRGLPTIVESIIELEQEAQNAEDFGDMLDPAVVKKYIMFIRGTRSSP